METNTLNKWIHSWGFAWVDGHEELYKGQLTRAEAADKINELYRKGAVIKRG